MSLRRKIRWTILTLSLLLVAPHESQSQTRAADWVKAGLDAAPVDAKIRAFEQAIQLDPNYTEAYYYLGLAYKAAGRFQEAEITLNKAYFKNPYALNNDIKTRILYELGAIYQQLDKNDKAKEALSGAKGLATAASAKGRICYDLGQLYLKEGNITGALAEFREGKALLPQNAKLFDDALALAESKKILDDKYNESLRMMRAERYDDAAALLKEVVQSDRHFKDSASQLEEAIRLAQRSKQTKRLAALYSQAVAKAQSGETAEAINLFDEIVRVDPNFKDAQLQLQELQAQRQARRVETTNTPNATNGRRVREETPPANDPPTPTPRAEPDLHEPLYQEGLSYLQEGNWSLALASFDRLTSIAPNYRDAQALLKSARDSLAQQTQQEIAALYTEGELALQNGEWRRAAQAFEKIAAVAPDYRDLKNKLADAHFNLNKTSRAPVAPASPALPLSMTTLAGAAAALLILPLVGVMVFSPITRARIFLLQGKYDRAAALYEKMLEKHPGKIKLYPVLANIYLLQNRRDERALKVYETILRLNILTNKREAINSILATHYLNQGRTDMSAIHILEKELDTKMRKMRVSS